jgi:hypothetical protein
MISSRIAVYWNLWVFNLKMIQLQPLSKCKMEIRELFYLKISAIGLVEARNNLWMIMKKKNY